MSLDETNRSLSLKRKLVEVGSFDIIVRFNFVRGLTLFLVGHAGRAGQAKSHRRQVGARSTERRRQEDQEAKESVCLNV